MPITSQERGRMYELCDLIIAEKNVAQVIVLLEQLNDLLSRRPRTDPGEILRSGQVLVSERRSSSTKLQLHNLDTDLAIAFLRINPSPSEPVTMKTDRFLERGPSKSLAIAPP